MRHSIAFWLVGLIAIAATTDTAAEELARVPSALVTIIDSVNVAAPQGGLVLEVPIREGKFVKSGDTLAKIDDREVMLRIAQAEVNLQQAMNDANSDVATRIAQNKYGVAMKELQRAERINSELPTTVSEAEVLLLRLSRDQSALEMEMAKEKQTSLGLTADLRRAELEQAKLERDRLHLRSPIGGMIVKVEHRVGEWVDAGKPVARVVRVDRLRAEGFLRLEEASADLIGREATITVGIAGKRSQTIKGEVVFVNPEANAVNGEVQVWAEFPNEDLALRPGLRGTLTIHEERAAESGKQR